MTTSDKACEPQPEVTIFGMLDCQVCVPQNWTDEQVIAFAECSNPSGTSNGWQIRRQGSAWLNGSDERVACSDRPGFVHIVLDV